MNSGKLEAESIDGVKADNFSYFEILFQSFVARNFGVAGLNPKISIGDLKMVTGVFEKNPELQINDPDKPDIQKQVEILEAEITALAEITDFSLDGILNHPLIKLAVRNLGKSLLYTFTLIETKADRLIGLACLACLNENGAKEELERYYNDNLSVLVNEPHSTYAKMMKKLVASSFEFLSMLLLQEAMIEKGDNKVGDFLDTFRIGCLKLGISLPAIDMYSRAVESIIPEEIRLLYSKLSFAQECKASGNIISAVSQRVLQVVWALNYYRNTLLEQLSDQHGSTFSYDMASDSIVFDDEGVDLEFLFTSIRQCPAYQIALLIMEKEGYSKVFDFFESIKKSSAGEKSIGKALSESIENMLTILVSPMIADVLSRFGWLEKFSTQKMQIRPESLYVFNQQRSAMIGMREIWRANNEV